MKDPSRNAELCSSFTFTGTIADIRRLSRALQLTISQMVAGRLKTDYILMIPFDAETDEFLYAPGDTVLVQDAMLYEKNSEMRLRISDLSQIRATSAQPGELNALAFSGRIVEVREENNYSLAQFEQTVADRFPTKLEVMFPSSVELEFPPKVGDIGFISHALFYEKDGRYRAKVERPTYSRLYSPDYVLDLGTIEAKELFI